MTNEEIINALSVLRTVLKAAKLAYEPAEAMIAELKENPVFPEEEIERAFCMGFVCNLKSMEDFKGDRIIEKFKAYKKSDFYKLSKNTQ